MATGLDLQMNLSIMDDQNQNMTGGQKLLLHWHHKFGCLNFPAVQRILRAVPFLSAKFGSASKCDLQTSRRSVLFADSQKVTVVLSKVQHQFRMSSGLVLWKWNI